MLHVRRGQFILLKDKKTISSSKIDNRSIVQGHDVRSCRDVMDEKSIDISKIGSRGTNEVIV
jgi:hypothetical protein